jgi:hypothetical protein
MIPHTKYDLNVGLRTESMHSFIYCADFVNVFYVSIHLYNFSIYV